MEESDLIVERKKKLAELRKLGIEPYGRRFIRTHKIAEIKGDIPGKVKIAGRIVALRGHGKAAFADIKDITGKMQLYFKNDILGDGRYEIFEKVDIGDFLGVEGSVFRTRTGELTIRVEDFKILAKSLRPLPEKWHGLKDVELRYRKRYLDLIANEEVPEIFRKRSQLIKKMREFLEKKGFLEVETPIMQEIPGGAKARPFITRHQALDTELYLRIAPELYLKRLLVGGLEKVYEINKSFRNEGIDTLHNPEFTMLEAYSAYGDYQEMMELTESLIVSLAKEILGKEELNYQEQKINLKSPWQRMSLKESLKKYCSFEDFSDLKKMRKIAKSLNLELTGAENGFEIGDAIFKKKVQASLINPVFILDYPLSTSPLAKSKPGNAEIVERFELFIGGLEIANAYSELNDPREQRKRFEEELKEERESVKKAIDEDYLEALEYGMPPTGGLGVGIDRLVMLFTNNTSIKEVILFPQMRPEI
ncbi:MAG: lysine--tRNA ligase [Candidatus Omnitrophica bacterium]|nr:lysine--tRNA ligase [Candidatus Omnitrophota bacterium]